MINDKNIQIVDDYLNSYFCSPSEKNFIKLGGNIAKIKNQYGSYRKFLYQNGYDMPTKAKAVVILDTRGMLVFEGTVKDAASKYGVHFTHVRRCALYGNKLRNEFTVKYKE